MLIKIWAIKCRFYNKAHGDVYLYIKSDKALEGNGLLLITNTDIP